MWTHVASGGVAPVHEGPHALRAAIGDSDIALAAASLRRRSDRRAYSASPVPPRPSRHRLPEK